MFCMSFSAGTQITDHSSHVTHFDHKMLEEFVVRMLHLGVRLQQGLWFVSEAHTEVDIDHTLSAAQQVLSGIANTRSSLL